MPDAEIQVGGPDDRLLAWRHVRAVTGLSRTTAWRLQNAGDFPRPVPISPGRVGWWQSELDAWKAARVERRPFASPRPVGAQTTTNPPVRPIDAASPIEPVPDPVRARREAAPRRPRATIAQGQIAFDF